MFDCQQRETSVLPKVANVDSCFDLWITKFIGYNNLPFNYRGFNSTNRYNWEDREWCLFELYDRWCTCRKLPAQSSESSIVSLSAYIRRFINPIRRFCLDIRRNHYIAKMSRNKKSHLARFLIGTPIPIRVGSSRHLFSHWAWWCEDVVERGSFTNANDHPPSPFTFFNFYFLQLFSNTEHSIKLFAFS